MSNFIQVKLPSNGQPLGYEINSKIFSIPLPIIFLKEPPGKNSMVFNIRKKRLKFYNHGIICGILHQEYLKRKKGKHFKDIELKNFNSIETIFFDSLKFYISFMP